MSLEVSMARPIKIGLDYYPKDCHLSTELKLLIAKYGLAGIGVVDRLLAAIFANKGYYIFFDEETEMLFAHENNIKKEELNSIIRFLLSRGYFENELFDRYQILTNQSIQNIYVKICKDSKRKSISIDNKYDVISENPGKTMEETELNQEETGFTPEIIKQSKENKKKEKKVKNNIHNFSETQRLMISTFGRNPIPAEEDLIEMHIRKYGFEKAKRIYKKAALKNFKSLLTLDNALNEHGELKEKEYDTYQKSTGTSKSEPFESRIPKESIYKYE